MYEEEGQQQGDGLDDEIGRLAPSLELIRDWPMYSPQRSPTEWCADQVLEFRVQWEWASAPMYSPQRSPTLWCFDREQFLDQPHQRESRSDRRCADIRITISLEDILKCSRLKRNAAKNLGVIESSFKRIFRYLESTSERFDREQFPHQPHQRESTSHRRCTGTRITISLEDILKCSRLKRYDAAKNLGVSISTLKRICRDYGISRWLIRIIEAKLNGCSVVEQMLLNNSDHQNSPGSEPLEVLCFDLTKNLHNFSKKVRPLQQRNNGVVLRDDTDEQNINLIPWINEVQPLQDIDIGAVFGDELDQNVIHIHEVRPLQQINNGVVIHDDTNEQNVNLIPWINEVQPVRDTNIGAVFGNELDENVIQIHEVPTLQQRNNGVVIHNDTEEQNVNLIPINEVQSLRDINVGVVFGDELDHNVIHIHEETERIETMATKGKATYVGEGNENSQVQRLQDFGNELDQNVIHIHEETERIEAMARKGKATYVSEGNENSQGYSLEEGRHVEVNSLMDEKLYSGVKDIQFQPSWPEVEIMQEDSSEQQILGELGPKNIGNKAVQKKEKGRSKKNIGHKVASAEKSCKKKNTTETPTRKYWTKRFISLEDLLQHVGRKRAEAAKALGVSVPTFKRWCRKYKITCWNGDGCPRPRVEPELSNNSVLQSSPGSIPAEVRGEKETSALLRAKQDDVTIKAKYGESILKFQLSSESGVRELNKEVAKRSLLELGSFNVEYLDEDEERILIACDEDFQACVKFFSRSSSNQVIRLLVKNKVSNSEKSHQSCSGRKRKRS